MVEKSTTNYKTNYDYSQYKDLKKLYSNNITVSHICEKLMSFNLNDDAMNAKTFMNTKNYDFAGVEENDVIFGYIESSKIGLGLCKDYSEEFNAKNLITDSTPIIDIMAILKDTPVSFILERNQVKSIVSRADLQKPPVRMFVFGYINLLEMNLLHNIHRFYAEDTWKEYLKTDRLNDAINLLSERKARNEDIDLSDCLQLCDKVELILQKEELMRLYGIESKAKGRKLFKEVYKLRDKLAHSQDIVTGTSWPEVIDIVQKVGTLLEKSSESYFCNVF